MLRQLTEQGIDILDLEKQTLENKTSIKTMIDRVRHSINRRHEYDFSHEVYEAMNGCLACKACASQCPIKVDVPSFRSRFLNIYHSRYQRPVKDYLVSNIESMLPLMAKAPSVVNSVLKQSWVQSLTASTVGYVDAPLLSVPTLKERVETLTTAYDLQALSGLSSEDKQKHVLIVQDPFTSYYDAEVVEDFVKLVRKLGMNPVLLPFKPNGKAQHIKGFLRQFKSTAQDTAKFLEMVADLDIPMVGVDPALVLCYRDEYAEVLGSKRGDFDVLTAHEWLHPRLSEFQTLELKEQAPWYLFAHCTEKTKMPNAEKEWGAIFAHFGAILNTVPVGCCGMAGTFGHEVDKLTMSRDIFDLSWKPNLDKLDNERCLITGYSCRSQVKRFEGVKPKHPVQALLTWYK